MIRDPMDAKGLVGAGTDAQISGLGWNWIREILLEQIVHLGPM
jgi:hypothetical protein